MTRKTIKNILSKLPKGTTLTVRQIQDVVEKQCPLIPADWEPYVKTRHTHDPKCHHKIQGVLYELKKKGLIIHNPSNSSYTF